MFPSDMLLAFLSQFEQGRALIAHGQWDWKVKTKGVPQYVWISESDSGNVQVCQASPNAYAVTKLADGFILHATINSDHAEVLWQAVCPAPVAS